MAHGKEGIVLGVDNEECIEKDLFDLFTNQK